RQGISVLGSRVLAVKGRTSGQWRTTPVNLLTHDGRRYLVAPRGETQWVRNLRAVGTGELRVGRRAEGFRGRELADDEKVPVLRAYLRRWKAEVGIFFEGTGPDSSDDQIRAIAPRHPAFEVLRAHRLAARGRARSASRSCPCREKQRMSRSNPRHNPPARDRSQAGGPVLAGPCSVRAGNYDVIPVPGISPQSPGIMRRGELCSWSRRTISCAAL
ncbi:MAG TPA: nitroreductase family deazaflavin-dependent oxidoreductase, partial [Streptosporangiaceae bacterium]|nr:nitroreductase family deazaflavin-dependent oxidoreductase [Streptosporangiaceae bacterium]